MKAIIIARVSTEEQKEAGLLPAQITRLENYCNGFLHHRLFLMAITNKNV